MSLGDPSASIPPAETTENASTEEPCLICELEAKAPCDVTSLELDVQGWKTEKLMLQHKSHQFGMEVTRDDEELQRMLRHEHDFVIDVIADPRLINKTDEKARAAAIDAKATFDGLSCAEATHGQLIFKVDGGDEFDMNGEAERVYAFPGAATVANDEPVEIFAPKSVFDDVPPRYTGGDTVRNVLGIVAGLFKLRDYKTVTVTARSCGRRPAEDIKAPLSELRAAVRVFRRSQMRFGVRIPPLGTVTAKRARDFEVNGERGVDPDQGSITRSETSYQAGIGAVSGTSKSTVYGDGIETPRDALYESSSSSRSLDGTRRTREEMGVQGADGRRDRIDGLSEETVQGRGEYVTREDIKMRLQAAGGLKVVLAHNGQEVDLLGLPKKIYDTCVEMAKLLTDVQHIINHLPRVGWSFEFDVKVFAGSILAEWYNDYVAEPQEQGRHLAVDWMLDLEVEMTLFDISIRVAFGIRATSESLETGVVIEIAGTLGGKASMGGRFELRNSNPIDGCLIAGQVTAELAVVGYLKAGGWTVADAKLAATGGLDIQNGRLEVDWPKRDIGLQGTLEWKPITVTGYIESLFWDKRMDPYEVMPRTPFLDLQDWSVIPAPEPEPEPEPERPLNRRERREQRRREAAARRAAEAEEEASRPRVTRHRRRTR